MRTAARYAGAVTAPFRLRSAMLVALQLALIAAVALPFGEARFGALGAALVAAGVAIGLWALGANRPGNFNVRPEPRVGGRLVTHGPYRYVRHPMYVAVLVFALGCCAGYDAPWRWAVLVALGIVLRVKAGVEEREMAALHPGYARYARARKRFVPYVW